MSQSIRDGQTLSLAIPSGQSIAISSITGTYSATVTSGASAGTVLATNDSGGGTFGPYATGAVVRLSAGLNSQIDYDIGVSPSNAYDQNAKLTFDSQGNVTGLVGPDGSLISFAGPAYTFAGLPAASANNLGMSARVTDIGPIGGSIFVSTGTYWKPLNGSIVLAQANGSVAAPIQTLSAAGKYTLPADQMISAGSLVLPANLLRVGFTLAIYAKFKHRGTGGVWTVAPRLGTTNATTDNSLAFMTGAATNDNDVWLTKEGHIATSTSFTADGFATPNSFTTGAFTDKASNFNNASVNYLGLYLAAVNAADFVDLIEYRIELKG